VIALCLPDNQVLPGCLYDILANPAEIFWSVTLYDAENSSGLANGQPFPSLGSRDKPGQNADGSTDLYLGPQAPAGKAGNWLATVPGKGYFRHPQALRPHRDGDESELEAGRYDPQRPGVLECDGCEGRSAPSLYC
jgi:hypothetical protein